MNTSQIITGATQTARNVLLALPYSAMAQYLEHGQNGIVARIASRIDRHIEEKNLTRRALEKPPLPDYFRDFALLQEVTKAACSYRCGEITVAHTTARHCRVLRDPLSTPSGSASRAY